LLFTGTSGVGKRTVAKTLAMAVNCRAPQAERPCMACPSCRHIAGGSDPDTIQIEPQGGILRIDQIRRLISVCALKPFGNGYRVAILAEAHHLNIEASNALLKLLEEPPDKTFLILTAHQPSDLLPTISSRCRHIRFMSLPPQMIADFLIRRHHVDTEQAQTTAGVCGGSLGEALRMIKAPWRDRRDWLIRAAGLEALERAPGRSAATALLFAAELAAHKEAVEEDLKILKTYIRDLWILPYAPERIVFRDCADRLSRTRACTDDERLSGLWGAVEKAQKDIAANANLRLTLDVMALRLAGLTASDEHLQQKPQVRVIW
jgi:DNA polymerase-3 subunit delta'